MTKGRKSLKPFKRLCRKCEQIFQPTGYYEEVCDKCSKPKNNWRKK
jgi:hypothetical protein